MDKTKKSLIIQTWRRCKSITRARKLSSSPSCPLSCPFLSPTATPGRGTCKKSDDKKRCPNTPSGCFSVYVGPDKQRFVVTAERANHPLFRMLLEEAESEYGFTSRGPLELPCNVDLFYRVLTEMDSDNENDDHIAGHKGLGCGYGYGAYRLLSPVRQLVAVNKL